MSQGQFRGDGMRIFMGVEESRQKRILGLWREWMLEEAKQSQFCQFRRTQRVEHWPMFYPTQSTQHQERNHQITTIKNTRKIKLPSYTFRILSSLMYHYAENSCLMCEFRKLHSHFTKIRKNYIRHQKYVDASTRVVLSRLKRAPQQRQRACSVALWPHSI